MLRSDFEYLITNRVLVVSGNIHSELQRRTKAGVFMPRLLLEEPEQVGKVQADFAQAGADVLVTGTAMANRIILHKRETLEQHDEINRRALILCKEAVGPNGLVFGELGPTGALLKPYGKLTEEDYREVYREQSAVFLDHGADGFILSGFSSLIEAEQCLIALRGLCSLPIIANMTFLEDGATKFGDAMEDCFQALLNNGADVVGIHGTLGPLEIDSFLEKLSRPYPLCVRPNAGYPVRLGNTKTYLSSPEYVAECAEMFLERGAAIIGGASGFTPDHIRAVADSLRGRKPTWGVAGEPEPEISVASSENKQATLEDSRLLGRKLGREPILSIELEPPRGLEVAQLFNLLEQLKPYGIDAVNIPENPLARARVSSIALARAIFDRTGIESIAHVTCRDRNLISLQAELLGAHLLGVHTILALTGDPAGVGDYPSATSIFDVDSQGLVEIMARMNVGKDFGMNDLGARTRFQIGVAANPLAVDLDDEMRRLEAKLKRGATFVQTQPVFNISRVEPFLKALAPFRVPVIFGVMMVRDYRHARFLNNEYPGIAIKDADLERFKNAEAEEQRQLGVQLARELLNELKPMSGGVYLMPSMGEEDQLLEVFKDA
ncbi:MAG: bifunctional homocysteine S-methyltransferase/methylenetetrahydrofolate reductase [Acidobacteriota bacterium]|nr:bifunctional homocysteine S-methyltransferase/methylenetetrahydrofolate reductase [Acidobacteriota bacterium]